MAPQQWQTVHRRRRYQPMATPATAPQQQASALAVYATRPTYASVLRGALTASRASHSVLPPPRQWRLRVPKFISSPDSPTTLKFPPSVEDSDWKNRCFRCFRLGHIAEKCANPRRCATCWGQGHDYHECPDWQKHKPHPHPPQPQSTKPSRRPPPSPPKQQPPVEPPRQKITPAKRLEEPDFLDLLNGSTQATQASTLLPPDSERPQTVSCFLARDSKYFFELDRLSKGLVVSVPTDMETEYSLDDIAKMVENTGVVSAKQFHVGCMPSGRYLVLSPEGTSALEIGLGFSEGWWDNGFSAALWSPFLEADVEIPHFKIWL